MPTPVFMTDHTLDALSNSVTNPHHLQYYAKLSANVTIDPLYAGRVVHLNSSGEYETGLPNTTRACHMPLFLWQSSNDPDVANPGASSRAGGWVAGAPTGKIKTLVATGGWELESTEYDTDATYTPGAGLTATSANTTAATGGRITTGTAYDVPLCGVVSRGEYTNCHGAGVIAFWSVWLPRYKAAD